MLFDKHPPLFYYALVTPDKKLVLERAHGSDDWTLPSLNGHGHHPHDVHLQERLGEHVETLALARKELLVLDEEFSTPNGKRMCHLIFFAVEVRLHERSNNRLLLADYRSAVEAVRDDGLRRLMEDQSLRARLS